MLFKNHLIMSLVLTGISLLISNTAVADDPTSFTSLSACRNHYNTKVQSGNESTEASDPWCKARMTALDFCTETALLNSIAINSYNATQIPAVRQTLQTNCQRQLAAQPTSGAPATGSTGGGAAGAAFNASGAPVPPTAPAQQNCSTVPVSEQSACNIRLAQYQRDLQTYQSNLQAFNQRQAAAAEQARQQQQEQRQQQGMQNMQGMQMMLGAMAPMLEGSGNRRSGSGGDSGNSGNSGNYDNNGNRSSGSSGSVGHNSPAAAERQLQNVERRLQELETPDVARATAEQRLAAREVTSAVPGSDTTANGVTGAPTSADGVQPPTTDLSRRAQQRNQEIERTNDTIRQRVEHLTDSTRSVAYTNVMNAAAAIGQASQEYVRNKELCVKQAELANKLCLEGQSPGMKAAKALVDFSGPVLAMMSSAQKACSSTRKVMNLAAMGVTVAKGVCVAAKVSCDAKCGQSATKLTTVQTKIEALEGALTADDAAGNTDCAARARAAGANAVNVGRTCVADLNVKNQTVRLAQQSLRAELRTEQAATGGTTNEMVANCNEKTRDILLMATNLMGMMMAKGSAKKCEEQLASSQGAGVASTATTAEYCASPEGNGTQFCKCQANVSAEGCSGSLAADAGALGDANNQRGANLKAGQGPNGFAGGGARGGAGSEFNLSGGTGSDSTGAPLGGLEAGGSVFGAPGAGSGGSVAGSAGAGAAGTAANAVNAGKDSDKKWNFGSFVATGGGVAGRSGSAGGNGSVNSQQQEAIERKIASDKYAAEITTSSGKSNFDKIKSVVRQISSTLDPNQ